MLGVKCDNLAILLEEKQGNKPSIEVELILDSGSLVVYKYSRMDESSFPSLCHGGWFYILFCLVIYTSPGFIQSCVHYQHKFNRYAQDDELLYWICQSIDEEKDPECLKLSFHVVEVVMKLFPDPSGFADQFASDLFEILSKYFPAYFTHVC